MQDSSERHLYGEISDSEGGRIIRVRGNGSEDFEAVLMTALGLGGALPKDANVEVVVFSLGSDAVNKFALVLNDHTKERKWKVGTNGVQRQDDPQIALEFTKQRTHITDKNFAVGMDGLFEIKDGQAVFRVPVTFEKGVTANDVTAQSVKSNTVEAPTIKGVVVPAAITPVPVTVTPAFDNSEGTPVS